MCTSEIIMVGLAIINNMDLFQLYAMVLYIFTKKIFIQLFKSNEKY